MTLPLKIDSSNNIQEYPTTGASFDAMIENFMGHTATSSADGYTLKECPRHFFSKLSKRNRSKEKRIIVANKVVTFASITVILALEYPISACNTDFSSVFNSSFILSNIKTLASTAIPTVRIIPAIPGKVSVASRIVAIPN